MTVDAVLLDKAMVARWGEDYRDKTIVSAMGSFPLRDVFAECGLVDPKAPPPRSESMGLWQIYSPRRPEC